MIKIKSVIHYEDTNSVEVTWIDYEVIPAVGTEGEEGYKPQQIKETPVRCHSYDDCQMDMLRADLGADAPQYADLISTVEANIKPAPPPPAPDVRQEILSVSQQALASGFLHMMMFDMMTRYIQGVQQAVNAATPQGQTPPTITDADLSNEASPYYSHAYVETKTYYMQLKALQDQK